MSIPVPDLDDRTFLQLRDAATQQIEATDAQWTLTESDPGMILVEAFAHLTEILLYRLNRVPDRMYAVFLNLLGTQLRPPAAATVELTLGRGDASSALLVPAGLGVTTAAGDAASAPVFVTTAPVQFDVSVTSVQVAAVNAAVHTAVLLGIGTGLAGQTVTLPNAPAVEGALRVAVELGPDEAAAGAGYVVGDRRFRDWQLVDTFADVTSAEEAFLLDPVPGVVTFAPAVDFGDGTVTPIAAVPAADMQILGWWSSGGGAVGNVDKGTLTKLSPSGAGGPALPGITVTNADAASGGRDVESVDNAMLRAPVEFHTRHRAVTKRDYELLAVRSSGAVGRARAFNRSDVWSFARPGEVEVVLVAAEPAPGPDVAESVRRDVLSYLQDRAPLGVTCRVSWANYKTVAVHGQVHVGPEEDVEAVRTRIRARLDALLQAPDGTSSAGPDVDFGATLHVSNLFRALEQAEPGVRYVDDVYFLLDDVPDQDVGPLVADGYQANTWFAGAGPTVFRTLDSGDGWEPSGRFPDETVRAVATYPGPSDRPGATSRPGWAAVATQAGDRARVYATQDLGEQWDLVSDVGWTINDIAWVERNGQPLLLLGGSTGLYEVSPAPGSAPAQVEVDPSQADLGIQAVDAFLDFRGHAGVVVAGSGLAGVWLSDQGGSTGSYYPVRPAGNDIRRLGIQYDESVSYIWACRASSSASETGCFRLRIDDVTQVDRQRIASAWQTLDAGWTGESCWGVSFGGQTVFAATTAGGVLRMDLTAADLVWRPVGLDCGLPRRTDAPGLYSVDAVAATTDGQVVFAAGSQGVYRSSDAGDTYESVSDRQARDAVTLPPTWLFQPGDHDILVETDGGSASAR